MKVGTAYVDIKTDNKGLKKGLASAHSRVKGAASKMASRLSIPLKVAGVVAAAAAVKVLSSSIKAASDLQETTSKFETVFAGQVEKANEFAATLRNGFAMSTEEAKRHLSSVQDLLVPMGMVKDAAANMSFEVVKLSADLGSFNNLPTGQVMADIQSALVGNFETMKKYGVVLNATVVSQKALDMGLAASKEELTAGQKAQAAYQLIVEGSTAAIGDMAKTSESYANQQKQMTANWQEILGILGNAFLPTATKIIKLINTWMKANEGLIKQKAEVWAKKFADSLEWIKNHWSGIKDFMGGVVTVGKVIIQIFKTVGETIGKVAAMVAGVMDKIKLLQNDPNAHLKKFKVQGDAEMSGSPTLPFSDYMEYAKAKISTFSADVSKMRPTLKMGFDSTALGAISDVQDSYTTRIQSMMQLLARARARNSAPVTGAGAGDIWRLREADMRDKSRQLKQLMGERETMGYEMTDIAQVYGMTQGSPASGGSAGGGAIVIEKLIVQTFLDDPSTLREMAIRVREELKAVGLEWGTG